MPQRFCIVESLLLFLLKKDSRYKFLKEQWHSTCLHMWPNRMFQQQVEQSKAFHWFCCSSGKHFFYDSPANCIHPPGEREGIIPAWDSLALFGNNTAVFKATQMLDDKRQNETSGSVQCWCNWWGGLLVMRWKGSRSLLPFVSVGNAVLHSGFDPAAVINNMMQKHPQIFLIYISIKKNQIFSVCCWSMWCYLFIVFTDISRSRRWLHVVRKNTVCGEMSVLWLKLYSPNTFPVWTRQRLSHPVVHSCPWDQAFVRWNRWTRGWDTAAGHF